MKLGLISDTHCQHTKLSIPEDIDVLIHAGDATYKGTDTEIYAFLNWFNSLKVKHKIFVPGNHDFGFQKKPREFQIQYSDIHILIDSGVTIDGVEFYGTPWTPFFYDWAFNGLEFKEKEGYLYEGGPGLSAKPDQQHKLLREVYGNIPDDTNVLICHGPPDLGNLGTNLEGQRIGSGELRKRIDELAELNNLKLAVFGHIHEGFGTYIHKGIVLTNVSTLDRSYSNPKPVTVISI